MEVKTFRIKVWDYDYWLTRDIKAETEDAAMDIFCFQYNWIRKERLIRERCVQESF